MGCDITKKERDKIDALQCEKIKSRKLIKCPLGDVSLPLSGDFFSDFVPLFSEWVANGVGCQQYTVTEPALGSPCGLFALRYRDKYFTNNADCVQFINISE